MVAISVDTLAGYVELGYLKGVQTCLDSGTDINSQSDKYYGKSPLHIAVERGDIAMVKRLLDRKADIDKPYERDFNRTPLMLAAYHGHVEILKLLLARGANTKLTTQGGDTLCHIAIGARKNAEAVWEILMDPASRIDPVQLPTHPQAGRSMVRSMINIIGLDGKSDPKTLATLIRHGADWRIYGKRDTFLHALIAGMSIQNPKHRSFVAEVIKHTLDAGISPFLENGKGTYAYELAKDVAEIAQVFSAKCSALAACVAQFDPAKTPLVDEANKPTELAKYACCESVLGSLLASSHWQDQGELIRVKRALEASLSAAYKTKFSAELDSSSNIRNRAGDSVLRYLTGGPRPEREVGR